MNKSITVVSILLFVSIEVFSQATIKIDGFFDDWNTNINTYIDDSLDSQGIELLDFSVCNDHEYLYVKIRFADEIDLTEQFFNPAEIMINIDADNNASTGYSTNNIGSEYGINFFDKFIFDDSDPNLVDTLSLYDLDVIPLPTYSSDEFEIAINRSLFSDTICISIREKIGNDFMPDNGSVFTYIFNNCSSPTTTAIDFSRNDPNNLRLMTYNVWGNGLINNNRVDEHRRIFASAYADIITFQECGNTTYNDVLGFLNTSPIYYPYIYPDLNSGNLTISKYPSLQSWQVADKIDAELIDLPDSIYSTDILILNGHPPCCSNNQGRQENFDALIQFIHDAKTVGGVIDLPINTPISFSGDMNLVGYSEQYYTIVNGTISDTVTFGNGGFPDWDNTPLEDQICYFNEKEIAYTWDKSNPSAGDFPPGRLDFVFFTNSVMSVDKSFIISTEHMSPSLLTQNNLFWDDTKKASDHFPVIVDFVLPMINQTCNSPVPTGLSVTDLTHDRAKVNWVDANTSLCLVEMYRVQYRVQGTTQWSTKTALGSGLCQFGLTTTSKMLWNLTPSTVYEYRVKAWYCLSSTSTWSPISIFTTLDVCPNVLNFAVSTPTNTRATFTWTAPSAPYSFVRIKLRVDTTGASWFTAGGFGVMYPALTRNKNGLTAGQSYRASSRTWCNPLGGPHKALAWTPFIYWTQPGTLIRIDSENSSIGNLTIYPNPSRDIFNITFISEEKQNLRVRILNVIGEEVYKEDLQQFIGEYVKSINLEQYNKAIYFLEIETEEGVITKKLILQ